VYSCQRLQHSVEEFVIRRGFVTAMGTFPQVGVSLLVARLDDRFGLFVVGEIPYDCLMMVDPDD
jgi:hypothetical protein